MATSKEAARKRILTKLISLYTKIDKILITEKIALTILEFKFLVDANEKINVLIESRENKSVENGIQQREII